jgi:4-amino-4-deoxy-L-arabinose transferase-like glycosyltransferase
MPKFPWFDLFIILLIALIGRALLLASGAVSFHSDEAIVALMARHINAGARPVFFYGQAYMGSLDAWLVALGFRLFGESVLSIRLVQSILYLLVVAAGYAAAWQFSRRRLVAAVAGLMLAVPAVNTALYTTATLGGYNETLLFGSLILLLAYQVARKAPSPDWRWAALGLLAGLGWWTNGLIIVTLIPAALVILIAWIEQRAAARRMLLPVGLALAGLIIGSAPWWIFDFTHDHAALATYLTNRQSGLYEGIGIPYVPPPQRALGLLLIGLPTLIGMRFPWSPDYFLLPLGVVALLIFALGIYRLLRGYNPLQPPARRLVLLMLLLFALVFVASTFGADPTGRYFLPLALPLSVILGALTADLVQRAPSGGRRVLALLPAALIIGYQALGQIAAASSPTGFTTQFDLVSHVPNDHDVAVVDFLLDNDLRHGYTNYWVAFRLAFLSGEQLQYHPRLPYKLDLSYNPADSRYPPYAEATAAAERIAYITTLLPALDAQLTADWLAQGITYQQARIGSYQIYYDFSRRPTPPDFDK